MKSNACLAGPDTAAEQKFLKAFYCRVPESARRIEILFTLPWNLLASDGNAAGRGDNWKPRRLAILFRSFRRGHLVARTSSFLDDSLLARWQDVWFTDVSVSIEESGFA